MKRQRGCEQPFAGGNQGAFAFKRELFRRNMYNVTVAAPLGGYECSVASAGSGTIERSDVTNVLVTRFDQRFDAGVSVSGLPPNNTVVVQNTIAQNRVTATASGPYNFPFRQCPLIAYSVSVTTQPANANCSAPSPSGMVMPNMLPIPVVCTAKSP